MMPVVEMVALHAPHLPWQVGVVDGAARAINQEACCLQDKRNPPADAPAGAGRSGPCNSAHFEPVLQGKFSHP